MLIFSVEDILAVCSLLASAFLLFIASANALNKGRIYSILLGALSMYVLLTLVSYFELATEFSRSALHLTAQVALIGTIVLVGTFKFCEIIFVRPYFNGRQHWNSNFVISASLHSKLAVWAGIISLILFATARNSLYLTWSEARSDADLRVVIATFLLFLSFSGVVSAAMTGNFIRMVLLAAINFSAFVLSGSRASVLTAFAFLGWIVLMQTHALRKKILILFFLMMLAFSAHVFLRFIRGLNPLDLIYAIRDGDLLQLLLSSSATDDFSGGEASIPKFFVLAVTSAGYEIYGFMTSVTRTLLMFVPSSIGVIEKPMDVTYRLWAEGYLSGYFNNFEGKALMRESFISGSFGSLHPTLFGEFFLAGRWLSLIVSTIFAGIICFCIDRSLARLSAVSSLFMLGPTAVGMLMLARGNSVIGFGYFVYLVLFVMIIEVVMRKAPSIFPRRSR
jgi:hypothetical protein